MLRYQGVTLVYLFCCVSPAASEVEAKAQQQTDIQLCVCLRAHSGGSPSLSPLLSWCCDLTTRLSLSFCFWFAYFSPELYLLMLRRASQLCERFWRTSFGEMDWTRSPVRSADTSNRRRVFCFLTIYFILFYWEISTCFLHHGRERGAAWERGSRREGLRQTAAAPALRFERNTQHRAGLCPDAALPSVGKFDIYPPVSICRAGCWYPLSSVCNTATQITTHTGCSTDYPGFCFSTLTDVNPMLMFEVRHRLGVCLESLDMHPLRTWPPVSKFIRYIFSKHWA